MTLDWHSPLRLESEVYHWGIKFIFPSTQSKHMVDQRKYNGGSPEWGCLIVCLILKRFSKGSSNKMTNTQNHYDIFVRFFLIWFCFWWFIKPMKWWTSKISLWYFQFDFVTIPNVYICVYLVILFHDLISHIISTCKKDIKNAVILLHWE